ncbi:MAG TPA: flagellar hook-length control protein FliK [Bradyrhizobium sp.]|nr:flagellar hook-length control protein FliK [Bradyrhizobium sp.]
MPISINPVFPVLAAQGAAPELVLQPGAVIDAEVLKILANDLVRIAIANLSIEVFSEIPLQVGQTLQLAVSQTPDGIRLAVFGQGNGVESELALASPGSEAMLSNAAAPDVIDLAPVFAGKVTTGAAPLKNPLTPMQALAVSAAAQTAATRQNSLAPLFANLQAAVRSDVLPPQLQQTIAQMLALRPKLGQNLSADTVKNAFQSSGLFLEQSLASGHALPSPAGAPDLKAALLVLRQTLQSLGAPTPEGAAPPAAALPPQPSRSVRAIVDVAPTDSASEPPTSPATAPGLAPEIDVEEVFLPQARLPVAEDSSETGGSGRMLFTPPPPPDARIRAAATAATLNGLQETPQTIPQKPGRLQQPLLDEAQPLDAPRPENAPQPRNDEVAAARTNLPPPPFRGALPSPQPAMPPSIAPDASLATIADHLVGDTDAAIARQVLLQVASLPDRADLAGPRTDPAAPRWNFEIPFSTPAGTAIAQFEIARDGGASMVETAKPAWRARFSLDVEPAGPVHALISIAGDRTSVRMWAERPATVAQLRAGVPQLNHALTRAELRPGDIVIRHGAPSQPSPAPAGHFLDRAL